MSIYKTLTYIYKDEVIFKWQELQIQKTFRCPLVHLICNTILKFQLCYQSCYLDGCFWCKKNAKIIILSGCACHCVADQVVREGSIRRAWLLGHIPTLVWEQEEV